jgi:hypothetical protein
VTGRSRGRLGGLGPGLASGFDGITRRGEKCRVSGGAVSGTRRAVGDLNHVGQVPRGGRETVDGVRRRHDLRLRGLQGALANVFGSDLTGIRVAPRASVVARVARVGGKVVGVRRAVGNVAAVHGVVHHLVELMQTFEVAGIGRKSTSSRKGHVHELDTVLLDLRGNVGQNVAQVIVVSVHVAERVTGNGGEVHVGVHGAGGVRHGAGVEHLTVVLVDGHGLTVGHDQDDLKVAGVPVSLHFAQGHGQRLGRGLVPRGNCLVRLGSAQRVQLDFPLVLRVLLQANLHLNAKPERHQAKHGPGRVVKRARELLAEIAQRVAQIGFVVAGGFHHHKNEVSRHHIAAGGDLVRIAKRGHGGLDGRMSGGWSGHVSWSAGWMRGALRWRLARSRRGGGQKVVGGSVNARGGVVGHVGLDKRASTIHWVEPRPAQIGGVHGTPVKRQGPGRVGHVVVAGWSGVVLTVVKRGGRTGGAASDFGWHQGDGQHNASVSERLGVVHGLVEVLLVGVWSSARVGNVVKAAVRRVPGFGVVIVLNVVCPGERNVALVKSLGDDAAEVVTLVHGHVEPDRYWLRELRGNDVDDGILGIAQVAQLLLGKFQCLGQGKRSTEKGVQRIRVVNQVGKGGRVHVLRSPRVNARAGGHEPHARGGVVVLAVRGSHEVGHRVQRGGVRGRSRVHDENNVARHGRAVTDGCAPR